VKTDREENAPAKRPETLNNTVVAAIILVKFAKTFVFIIVSSMF
jgi:hypothetical protein